MPRSTHINAHPRTHLIVVAPLGASTTSSKLGAGVCAFATTQPVASNANAIVALRNNRRMSRPRVAGLIRTSAADLDVGTTGISTRRRACQLASPLIDDRPRIIGLLSPVHVLCEISQCDRREPLVVKVLHVLLESFARCVHPRMFEIGSAVELEDGDPPVFCL